MSFLKLNVPVYGKSSPLAIFLLVVVSGICGISYEVLYARLLTDIFGDLFLTSAGVFISFLIGLALGSIYAYRLRAYLYAIQIGSAIYSLLFLLFQSVLFETCNRILLLGDRSMTLQIVLIALILIPISSLVGLSVPLLAANMHHFLPMRGFRTTYLLYNLGAAASVLLLEFWCIWELGIRGTLLCVSMLSVISGVFFFPLRNILPAASNGESPFRTHSNTAKAIFFLGVASAIYQLLALKIFQLVLGPFRENFAILLTLVLLGQAVATIMVWRYRITLRWWTIIAMLCAIVPACFLTSALYFYAERCVEVQGSYQKSVLLKFVFCTFIVGPAAIGFGGTIPSAMIDDIRVARFSGALLCICSLGNCIGYLVMAMYLYSHITIATTFAITAFLCLLSFWFISDKTVYFLQVGFVTVALSFVAFLHLEDFALIADFTTYQSPERLAQLYDAERSIKLEKSHLDTLAIISSNEGEQGLKEAYYINGYTSIYLDSPAERLVGILPAAVAKNRNNALVIGLGSGITAGNAAQMFGQVDVVEINQAVINNAPSLARHNLGVMQNPKVRVFFDDGMRYILASDTIYDVVISTVETPRYFSSSKLYTVDFLKAIKRRLNTDGVFATWFDARMGGRGVDIFLSTLSSQFNHCGICILKENYYLLCCSDSPLAFQRTISEILSETTESELRYYGRGLTSRDLYYCYLSFDGFTLFNTATKQINTVDRPILERAMSHALDTVNNINSYSDLLGTEKIARTYIETMKSQAEFSWPEVLAYWTSEHPGHPLTSTLKEMCTEETQQLEIKISQIISDKKTRFLRECVRRNQTDFDIWHELGHHLEHGFSRDFSAAEDAFINAARKDSSSGRHDACLSSLYLQVGEYGKALDAMGRASQRDERLLPNYYQLQGRVLEYKGSFVDAINAYGDAVELLSPDICEALSQKHGLQKHQLRALMPFVTKPYFGEPDRIPIIESSCQLATEIKEFASKLFRSGAAETKVRAEIEKVFGSHILFPIDYPKKRDVTDLKSGTESDALNYLAAMQNLRAPLETYRSKDEQLLECNDPFADYIREVAFQLSKEGKIAEDIRNEIIALFGEVLLPRRAVIHVNDIPSNKTTSEASPFSKAL